MNCWKTGSQSVTRSKISSMPSSAMKVARRPRSATMAWLARWVPISCTCWRSSFRHAKAFPKATPVWQDTEHKAAVTGYIGLLDIGHIGLYLARTGAYRLTLGPCQTISPFRCIFGLSQQAGLIPMLRERQFHTEAFEGMEPPDDFRVV